MFFKLGSVSLGTKSVLGVSVQELQVSFGLSDTGITYTLDKLLPVISDNMFRESDLAVTYLSAPL